MRFAVRRLVACLIVYSAMSLILNLLHSNDNRPYNAGLPGSVTFLHHETEQQPKSLYEQTDRSQTSEQSLWREHLREPRVLSHRGMSKEHTEYGKDDEGDHVRERFERKQNSAGTSFGQHEDVVKQTFKHGEDVVTNNFEEREHNEVHHIEVRKDEDRPIFEHERNNANRPELGIEHKRRLEHLHATCRRHPELQANMSFDKWVDSQSDVFIKELAHHFIVSDNNRIISCQNLKAASTTWRLIFLNNTYDEPLAQDVNFVSYLSSLNRMEERRRQRLESYDLAAIRHRLKSYYKMVSVRHPLDRLLSGYKDKLHRDRWYQERLGAKIHRWLNDSSMPEKKRRKGRGVTFTQFLQYVRAGFLDSHWEKQYEACDPCSVPYDFVSTSETLHSDADFIIRHVLRGRTYNMAQRTTAERVVGVGGIAQDYGAVPSELMAEIVKLYATDFELFGYSAKPPS